MHLVKLLLWVELMHLLMHRRGRSCLEGAWAHLQSRGCTHHPPSTAVLTLCTLSRTLSGWSSAVSAVSVAPRCDSVRLGAISGPSRSHRCDLGGTSAPSTWYVCRLCRLCRLCGTSLRLAATRCDSLRLAATRCHFGQAFARVLRGRALLAPSPRDKRLSVTSVRYAAILVKLFLGAQGRACPALAPEIKGWWDSVTSVGPSTVSTASTVSTVSTASTMHLGAIPVRSRSHLGCARHLLEPSRCDLAAARCDSLPFWSSFSSGLRGRASMHRSLPRPEIKGWATSARASAAVGAA